MTILRAARRGLAALAVATLLASCAIAADDVQTDGSGSGSSSASDTAGVRGDTLEEDVELAVEATDGFWRSEFQGAFGRDYVPPAVAGGYVGEGGPTCSGQRSVPFNAFYCPSEDLIAWDDQLLAAGYEQVGDAWVYLIIAHEWAHAVQARLQRDQVSVAAELRADCLAGATLVGATRLELVGFEAGDTDELARTLVAVADEFPWTDERDHGDARERIGAFQAGADGGVAACID